MYNCLEKNNQYIKMSPVVFHRSNMSCGFRTHCFNLIAQNCDNSNICMFHNISIRVCTVSTTERVRRTYWSNRKFITSSNKRLKSELDTPNWEIFLKCIVLYMCLCVRTDPPNALISGYEDSWHAGMQDAMLQCNGEGNPKPHRFNWTR